MGLEDSGVTPRDLTLRLVRMMKPRSRGVRPPEYQPPNGFLPWRSAVNLNRRYTGSEIEGKGHGQGYRLRLSITPISRRHSVPRDRSPTAAEILLWDRVSADVMEMPSYETPIVIIIEVPSRFPKVNNVFPCFLRVSE